MMQASEQALALIRKCEGFSPVPRPDAGGRMQIGYGHDIRPGELYAGISEEDAETLVLKDVRPIELALNRLVTMKINQNQFDALVDFVYNIGIQEFEESTLLMKLNSGDLRGAAGQFDRWVYSNGQVVGGLSYRRSLEKSLFCLPA